MAKYRQVHVDYWQDGFVLDLTPEEKYFYLYLMTNSKTTQCGIYELPLRIIETETGYNRETVEKLLDRFEQYGKIRYHTPTREIMLLNWIKFNWINSPKVVSLINKELQDVKHIGFIKLFIEKCKEYGYRIDTLSIDLGEEREVEREEEQEGEREELKPRPADDAIKFYSDNFGVISPYIQQNLFQWIQDLSEPVVVKAMQIAVERNVHTWKYVETILKNWWRKNITTLEAVEAEQKAFERSTGKAEVLPKWFEDERNNKAQPKPKDIDPEEAERKRQELKQFQQQFGKGGSHEQEGNELR